MKKKLILAGIIVLSLVLLLSGCTENNDDGNGDSSEPKTVTMNAQEYGEDMDIQMSQTSMTQSFKSLNDGDTLIFQDSISSISYDDTTDSTTVNFEYSQDADNGGTQTSTASFLFEGNLTADYSVGDEVKITVKIKHVTVTIQGMTIDMEIYEEYWESEQYFTDNYMTGNPYKPLSSDKITKV